MGSTQGHVGFSQRRLALQSRQGQRWREYLVCLAPGHELWEALLGWPGAQLLLECLALDRVEAE